MAINDWPEALRPREKLLDRGPESLTDAELLAILLRTGSPGRSAIDLAVELLRDFGGFRSLFSADQSRFCRAKGLGLASFVQFQAIKEINRRHLREALVREEVFTSSQCTKDYLLAELRDEPREVFSALFLDSKHRLIAYRPLFYGTIDTASIYPREVVRLAIHLQAAKLIFAHNHPSGCARPSEADIAITGRLVSALALVDVTVLDHLVVGDGQISSLAELGRLG